MPRADQRHWAEVFVRGLLTVDGRKTIRKISDHVAGGGAEQCLQQFVNQSTWQWHMVRRDLALLIAEAMEPKTWVIADIVIPKNGSNSVGVGRQFVYSEGRVVNCQFGIAVFLVGDKWSCPVNWRLPLPPSWDGDKDLRAKARLPDDEYSGPRWQHMLDAIDEMTTDWGLVPAPVLVDVRSGLERELNSLVRGLEERYLEYALRVGANRPAATLASARARPQTLSFAEFINESITRNTAAHSRWGPPTSGGGRSQLVAARLPTERSPAPTSRHRTGNSRRHAPRSAVQANQTPRSAAHRHVVGEWSPFRNYLRSIWLTSFDQSQLPSLPETVARLDLVAADLATLYDDLGLRHFEGRSYPGWHHYVTLISVAAACKQLSSN
ncbi:MAG: transposase [Streptosporangiaceae bacterium]|nr:transposase [Streptosporangiaceae bacterium]